MVLVRARRIGKIRVAIYENKNWKHRYYVELSNNNSTELNMNRHYNSKKSAIKRYNYLVKKIASKSYVEGFRFKVLK